MLHCEQTFFVERAFRGGPGCFVLSGYSTDDCQSCDWYTFTQARSVNSFTQDSQNITDGKLTSLSSFVLFSVQKGASFINDQPTWRKTFRITQLHFSCLMRRLHVCLLSINYSGFTALESPGQRLGLHFGLIRGHLNRSGMSSRLRQYPGATIGGRVGGFSFVSSFSFLNIISHFFIQ